MPHKMRELKYRFSQLEPAPDSGDKKPVHELYIYDEVTADPKIDWSTFKFTPSETSADYFRDTLAAIPDGDPINIHINSEGGNVAEGVAIYNQLRHKADAGSKVTAYVDGSCYSVAVDIALAADEIHMGLGTSMFLHFPWMACVGNADQLRNFAEQLDTLGEASMQLYLNRTHGKVSENELRSMMKAETLLSPDMCLQYGFCDVIDKEAAPKDEPEEHEKDPEEPEKDPESNPSEDSETPDGSGDDTKQQFVLLMAAQRETLAALAGMKTRKKEPEEKKPAFMETLTAALTQLGNNR